MRCPGDPEQLISPIVAMFAIVTAMAFIPEQRAPLLFGLVSAVVMLLGYALRRRFGP
jgi:GABA permease